MLDRHDRLNKITPWPKSKTFGTEEVPYLSFGVSADVILNECVAVSSRDLAKHIIFLSVASRGPTSILHFRSSFHAKIVFEYDVPLNIKDTVVPVEIVVAGSLDSIDHGVFCLDDNGIVSQRCCVLFESFS